jgi:SAM-dependent methyltransferase
VHNLRQIANNTSTESLANEMRRKRFGAFRSMLDSIPRPVKILDVGGTQNFWDSMWVEGTDGLEGVSITLLNLFEADVTSSHFTSVAGDARNLSQFTENDFDIVFSNSVIEHVGTFQDQVQMADEVQRVGKHYFVQTPNRFFPIEPHFLFPLFQFLPISVRVWLVMHFSVGWYKKFQDRDKAEEAVRTIRLLSLKEMKRLFPNCSVLKERYYGLVKSFIVYDGPISAEAIHESGLTQ